MLKLEKEMERIKRKKTPLMPCVEEAHDFFTAAQAQDSPKVHIKRSVACVTITKVV
jgi:hypothetical protein